MSEEKGNGKKFAKEFTTNLSYSVLRRFASLNRQQLLSVIKLAENFSTTNCGWAQYVMKDAIIKFGIEIQKFKKRNPKTKNNES